MHGGFDRGRHWRQDEWTASNIGYPAAALEMAEPQKTARTFGVDVFTSEIRRAEDIVSAFAVLKDRAEALYICADPLMNANRTRVNALALAARLPTMHGIREYVETSGLMSYGPNLSDSWRRSADYVDKILHGRNRPKFRSSNPPNSIWSSTWSPPRCSASTCRRRFSPAR
jgi:ABC-type uncharacterized transport system substrate-binding protein